MTTLKLKNVRDTSYVGGFANPIMRHTDTFRSTVKKRYMPLEIASAVIGYFEENSVSLGDQVAAVNVLRQIVGNPMGRCDEIHLTNDAE